MNKKWCGILLALISLIGFGAVPRPAAADDLAQVAPYDDYAFYLTMRDGVQIAVDVILPADLADDAQIPALMDMTRYWRALQNLSPEEGDPSIFSLIEAGYALVLVDARGSGASFGYRPIEWSPDEIADYGEIVDWIVSQPWSNGKVGAYGISYESNTAELLTANNRPAVKAVAPRFGDFDPQFHLAMPSGVFNDWFIRSWNEFNQALDRDDICFVAQAGSDAECNMIKQMVPGVKQVDDDTDRTQLAAAVEQHAQNIDVYGALQVMNYRDDIFGGGLTIGQISPYGQREAIENSGAALYVWIGWLDAATVDGALSRYLTFSNPQKLIIGPWSHGGSDHIDPFLPDDTPTDPSEAEQVSMLIDFFDGYLKGDSTPTPEREISYYTLNAGTWTTTDSWPPEGFESQRWYFGADGTLTTDVPTETDAADEYTVDFTATTGDSTRWHTQLGGDDVIYPNRAEEDQKLLTYTSAPMSTNVEITGSPVITLYVASTETDGAFFAYLEDVAPDGRVTYITEGQLRAIHRSVSDAEPPYVQLGPYHSYLEADAAPLVPGEVAEIRFNLYATSVLIEAGHSIRIALAGHDASVFARYPAKGTPVWTVGRNSVSPSYVDLPLVERP
jgi:putative CocE/NonD family hydrolase